MLLDRVDAGSRYHSVLRSTAAAGTDCADDLALGNDQDATFGSDHTIERHRGDAGASRADPLLKRFGRPLEYRGRTRLVLRQRNGLILRVVHLGEINEIA